MHAQSPHTSSLTIFAPPANKNLLSFAPKAHSCTHIHTQMRIHIHTHLQGWGPEQGLCLLRVLHDSSLHPLYVAPLLQKLLHSCWVREVPRKLRSPASQVRNQ